MLAPRITSSLRAVAVDPTDAQNVYVATEEGTLAHSTDGGVSWDEIELSPWLIESATVSLGLYGDDYKAIDVFAGLNVSGYFAGANLNRQFQPTGRDGAGQGPGIVGPPPMGLANLFVYPVRFAQNPEPLLGSLAQQELRDPNQALQRSSVGRGGPRENVRDIAVCRGGNFGLLVASGARLFGSSDGTTRRTAAAFLKRHRKRIVECVSRWTNERKVTIELMAQKLTERAGELGLMLTRDEAELSTDVAAYLATLVTHYRFTGKFKRSA